MTKEIKLLDYKSNPSIHTVENFEDVILINLAVISGDEVMVVTYKDGTQERFDSWAGGRFESYFDGEYVLYTVNGINLLEDERFLNRTDSYDYMWE